MVNFKVSYNNELKMSLRLIYFKSSGLDFHYKYTLRVKKKVVYKPLKG